MRHQQAEEGREAYASLGQAYAHAACHHAGVCESWLHAHRAPDRPADLAVSFLAAHREHEAAWRVAKSWLAAGERLPNFYRNCAHSLCLGRALAEAVRHPGENPSAADVSEMLKEAAESTFAEYRSLAETHPRYRPEEDTKDTEDTYEAILSWLEVTLGDVPTALLRLANEAR